MATKPHYTNNRRSRSRDRERRLKRCRSYSFEENDGKHNNFKKKRLTRKDNHNNNNHRDHRDHHRNRNNNYNHYQHHQNNYYYQQNNYNSYHHRNGNDNNDNDNDNNNNNNNNNKNHYHHHSHHHNHNHNHHHYHHHHHHSYNNNRNRYHSNTKRKYLSVSSGFTVSTNNNNNNNNDDDNNNDLEGTVNLSNIRTIYRSRYTLVRKLGQGTFGSVIECIDNKRNIRVAIKIVRSVRRYLDAATIEVDILNKLDELDINRNSLVVRLYKSFRCIINNLEHSCLVFEKCGNSLYDYIKKNKYNGFRINHLAHIGYQLFHSINFCHLNKLTHTDLKLENILFISSEYHSDMRNDNTKYYYPESFEIRLIDFGGATFESDHHSSIINTRQYRGPEVILGNKWSYSSDIWSLGCILSELYSGDLLFGTHQNEEHLQLILKILNKNKYPKHMMMTTNSNSNKSNSNSNSVDNNTKLNNKSIKYIQKTKKLNKIIHNNLLFDLINKCLQIDPNKRITAQKAKEHPFFIQYINSNNNNEFMKIFNKCNNNKVTKN